MQAAYEEDATLQSLVHAFHDAVNRRDLIAAQALVTDPVDVSGPRGTHSITAQAFADWIIASGIRLRPLAAHRVDALTMVVEQKATWPDTADTGAGTTPGITVATLFRLSQGALGTIHRFESLRDALRAAGDENAQP